MEKLISFLVEQGWFLAAAFGAISVVLWRRNIVLSDKLYDVGMASVKSSTEFRTAAVDFTNAIANVEKELIRRQGK